MEFEKVRDVIVETLGCEADAVTPTASLAEDLGADSLAAVELVIALEEASGLSIPEEDAAALSRGSAQSPAPSAPAAAQSPVPAPAAPAQEEYDAVTSPLVGAFYLAPAPDQPPYVQVGDRVKKGQTLCLIEAMKMMSEIPAPCDCIIQAVLKEDGELVAFGDALVRYLPC